MMKASRKNDGTWHKKKKKKLKRAHKRNNGRAHKRHVDNFICSGIFVNFLKTDKFIFWSVIFGAL